MTPSPPTLPPIPPEVRALRYKGMDAEALLITLAVKVDGCTDALKELKEDVKQAGEDAEEWRKSVDARVNDVEDKVSTHRTYFILLGLAATTGIPALAWFLEVVMHH